MSRHRREPKQVREAILTMLGKHPQGMTIADISRRLGFSKQGAAKHLKTLCVEGQLERTPWINYGMGRIAYKLTNLAIMQDPDNEYIDNE